MTNLLRGLCSYRKLCLNYSYIADKNAGEEQEHQHLGKGPPSRVFQTGVPEYSPAIELYAKEEFPLKDDAFHRTVRYYLAMPIFGPGSHDCLGVLEFLWRSYDRNHIYKIADLVRLISAALEKVELRTSDYSCHFDMENDLANRSTGLRHAFSEIQKAIKMACKRHKLPFAQTWTPSSDESCIGEVMSTTKRGSFVSDRKYSQLQEACTNFQLMKGQGVVWRALSCQNSCFCRDISQLRITDYSFAHIARILGLTSSFAICLQSNLTGDDIYVLELFLPSYKTRDPRSLLNSLLATMKQHLRSFKILCGRNLGKELYVEVLRVSEEDELDSFVICRTATSSGSLGPEAQGMEDVITHQHFSSQQSVLDFGDTNTVDEQNAAVSLSSLEGMLLEDDDINIGSNNFGLEEENSDTQEGMEGRNLASEFEVINQDALEKCFGMKLIDAALIFNVSKSTLKRKCRKYGIKSWPGKRNKATTSSTIQDHETHIAEYGQHGSSACTLAGEATTSNPCHFQQPSTMPTSSIMTIKAAYGEGTIIKFRLPISSGMIDLEREVVSRLQLETGNFKIRYQDEDDEWILLTRDEDLRMMESMGKTTIRMSIRHD